MSCSLRFLHKADYQTPDVYWVLSLYLPFARLLPVTQLAALDVACAAEAVKDLPLHSDQLANYKSGSLRP